jgi:hypothetical protein
LEEHKNLPTGKAVTQPEQPVANIPEIEHNKIPTFIEENISSEENILPEIKTATTEQQPTTNNQPQTTNMEVHHHAHNPAAPHHKKNWKAYFWEFLMLFLAVFCGFLAEYQLEHKIERDREKEYILSMIEDAKTDTANIHTALAYNSTRIFRLDSLANKCFNYGQQASDDAEIYRLFLLCVRHPDFVSPTERTMMQLKNAAGMRLLRKKIAADTILQYDDFSKKLINQQAWYENMLKELVESGMPIFNFKYFPTRNLATLKSNYAGSYDAAKIIATGKPQLITLGNRATMYRNVVIFYMQLLKDGEQHAVNLIQTLEKEYHLK